MNPEPSPSGLLTVADVFASTKQPISFEIFPPKGELSNEDALVLARELAELEPCFISVTYSAGGSGNARATTDVASMIQVNHGIPAVHHLTAQGLTRAGLVEKIDQMKAAGIKNVLAMRGDHIPGAEILDFGYACELIAPLREAGFCVGATAYPEGHVTCLSLEDDIVHLREKQDAGAQFLVTQLFFDNDDFYRFREKTDAAGITIPMTCGIMPIMSKAQVERMIFMCGASLPAPIVRLLNRYEGDEVALRQAGIEYATAQLVDLKANGVDGLHIYTMNRPEIARANLAALRP